MRHYVDVIIIGPKDNGCVLMTALKILFGREFFYLRRAYNGYYTPDCCGWELAEGINSVTKSQEATSYKRPAIIVLEFNKTLP